MEVQKIEAGGFVAKWNAENPACRLHVGDKVLQANGKVTAAEILQELSTSPTRTGVTLVVAESERRLHAQSRQAYTFKECQKEWPKDAEQQWASMLSTSGQNGILRGRSPHTWAVSLRRSPSHGWGLAVDPKSMLVLQVVDEGPQALWNLSNPLRAVLAGDRILQANGADQAKAIVHIMKQAEETDLLMSRDADIGSTAPVHLVKATGQRLGVLLNEDGVVKQVQQGPGNLVAEWNAKNPTASVRIGDLIMQAAVYTSLERIFLYLQEQESLDLVVLRVQRRMDLDGTVLTFAECSVKYSAVAAAHWATMHPVPVAPATATTAPTIALQLEQAKRHDHNAGSAGYEVPRSLLRRQDFYSTLAEWQATSRQAIATMATEAIKQHDMDIPAGSVFACPCCATPSFCKSTVRYCSDKLQSCGSLGRNDT